MLLLSSPPLFSPFALPPLLLLLLLLEEEEEEEEEIPGDAASESGVCPWDDDDEDV